MNTSTKHYRGSSLLEEVYKYGISAPSSLIWRSLTYTSTMPSNFALWLILDCQSTRQFWFGWVENWQKLTVDWQSNFHQRAKLLFRHGWCVGQTRLAQAWSVFVDFIYVHNLCVVVWIIFSTTNRLSKFLLPDKSLDSTLSQWTTLTPITCLCPQMPRGITKFFCPFNARCPLPTQYPLMPDVR